MLGVSFLAGLLILVYLFIAWYGSGDPLVSLDNPIFSILLLAYADVWVF